MNWPPWITDAMPVPVAPRLLGADAQAGLLLMEDLGDGATLADSLMAAGRARVQGELLAYAEALGSLHAWSMGHASEAARLRARHGLTDGAPPRWRVAAHRGKEPFRPRAATLGVACDGVAEEIDQVHRMIIGTNYLGLVHGDPCPDNVRADRRQLPDRRLRDRGLGSRRLRRRLSAGAVPEAARVLPACPVRSQARPSRPTGPGSGPPGSSWDRTGRASQRPSWPPRSSAAGRCSPKPGRRPRLGNDNDAAPAAGMAEHLQGPATAPSPGSRPPPPPCMTGSPSAGPGFASRTTRPSRSPALRWRSYLAVGSPSRETWPVTRRRSCCQS